MNTLDLLSFSINYKKIGSVPIGACVLFDDGFIEGVVTSKTSSSLNVKSLSKRYRGYDW